jgi:diguanylate cyclase (GGDEF)-like protein
VAVASTVVVVQAWYNVSDFTGLDARQTYATSLIQLGILLAAALTMAGIAWWLVVRLHESQRLLRDLAVRDPLTGLYNRRYFREVYAAEMQRARRSGVPFSVAMLDLDGFKAFNDTNGHAAGDEVLESFADVLRASVRSGDVLARYGGDEFVLLMPSTTAGNASTAIARLERNLAQWRPLGAPKGLYVSIGVSTWDAFTEPLERADMRMYESKRDKALTEALQIEPMR